LYIKDDPEEGVEDALDVRENKFSNLSEEEREIEAQGGKEEDPNVHLDKEEIGAYCKKFLDFMQEELKRRYGLRSRKRSQTQDQN